MGKRLDRSNVLVVSVGSEIVGRHRDNADHKCSVVSVSTTEVEVRHAPSGRKSTMTLDTLANRYMVAGCPEKTLLAERPERTLIATGGQGNTVAQVEVEQPQLPIEPEAVDPDVVTAPGVSLVKAGDWNLYRQEKTEEETVRDIDLARRAELSQPRAIRRTIKQLVDDGLIELVSEGASIGTGNPDGLTPRVYEVTVKAPIGSGATIDVTELHANQAAVAHIINRLRTPKAVELQKSIITAFLLLRQGRIEEAHKVATGQAPQAGSRADLELQLATLRQMVADGLIDSKTATAQQAIIVSKITGYDLTKAPQVTFERWSPVQSAVESMAEGERLIVTKPVNLNGHVGANEIGKRYGLSGIRVGQMARALGIRGDLRYGKWSEITKNGVTKLNDSFDYNEDGVKALHGPLCDLNNGNYQYPGASWAEAIKSIASKYRSTAAE